MKSACLLIGAIFIAVFFSYANAQLLDFTLEPDILASREIQLNYGQSLELTARISGPKLLEARDITLMVKILETGETRYFSKLSHDTFKLNLKMPENKQFQRIFVEFELKADIGQPISTKRRLNIVLTDELVLNILEPSESPFSCGPIKSIKAKIAYKNGAPFENDKLLAKLIVDGTESIVTLLKTDNIYVAELYDPIPEGEHQIALVLFGNFSGSSSVKTRQCIWPLITILILLVVFATIGFRVFFVYLKKTSEIGMQKRFIQQEQVKEQVKEEEKEEREIEEIKVLQPQQKPKPMPVAEARPGVEELAVEKPKPRYELPFALPKRKEQVIEIKEEKPKEEVVVTKEMPPYAPQQPAHKTVIEMEGEQKEESKPSRLFPFLLPKKKTE